MRDQKFGIEIELTGITREKAAEIIGIYLGSPSHYDGGFYKEYSVMDEQNRKWKVMYDSSIMAKKKNGTRANDDYKVEFVSPICEYSDIPRIQEIIRQLRHAGGGGRGEQRHPCTYQRSPAQCKNAAQPYEHHVQQGGSDL